MASFSDISALKFKASLGPKIGRARRVGKPSEVDGDGDGFVTGADGEDNVPAPVVNAPDWVKNFGGVDGFVREHRNEAGEDFSPAELFERSGMSRDRFVEVRGAARASVNDDAEAIIAEADVEHADLERARGNVGKIDAVASFYDERRDAAFERLVAEVRRWEGSSDKGDPKKVAEHEKVYEKLLEEFLFEKTRAEVFEGRKRVLRDQVQDKFLERLARLSGERPREGSVRVDVPEDVAAEAARRVDDALVKRQRVLASYLRGRYRDDEAPWLEMSPKRRKSLVAAADEGDEDAINELLDWAKQAYSHERIVGKNGQEYRVEVAARYITGGEISLYAQFFDSDGESVGESERLIRGLDSDRGYVLNKRLFIDEDHKNSGVGGIYISHANMYLSAAGLKRAAVQTTDDGPFVWAKLGFSEEIIPEYVDNMRSQLRRYNNGRVSIIDNDLDAEIINYLLESWDNNSESVRHIDFIFALSNKNAPGTRAFEQRDKEIRDWFVDNMPLEAGDFDFAKNKVLPDPRVLLQNIKEKSLAQFNLIDGRLVKVLGPKLGDGRKPTKPSDIDGDGDGFVTGVDGRDNVPAPAKTILDLFKGMDRLQIHDMLVDRERDFTFSDSELADLGLSKSEFDDLLASGIERGEQRFIELEKKLNTKPKSARKAESDFYEAPGQINQNDIYYARRALYDSIDNYKNTIKTNGDNQDLVEQARKNYEDVLRKYIAAVALERHRKDNKDRYNSILDSFKKRWKQSIRDEADVAGGILEKIDPRIKQEAKDRVDDGIQKRLEIFANYIDKRYGVDASPWEDMYPSRLDRLASRAQDGDDQAIRELEAWAKQMYSHDEIIGKNGKKYRIKATAQYWSDNDELEIGAVIYHVDEDGREIQIGDSIRTINNLAGDDPSITNHEMFIRRSEHKNSGIATIYNYHAFLYAATAGIEDADVGAVDDGPFVWAKMGFRGEIGPDAIEHIAEELKNFQQGKSSIIKDPTDAEIIDYLINQWKAKRPSSSSVGRPAHLDFIMALSNNNQPGSAEHGRRAAEIKEWFLENMPMDSGRFNFAANGINGDPRRVLKNSTKSLNVLDLSGVRLVKGLGPTIGGKPRVGKPSEVDGDGDGFVTGVDGEDNVPAPLPKIFEKWKNASRNTLEAWFNERTNEDGIGFSDSDLADIGISREDFDNFVERGRKDADEILEQAREIASATPSGIPDAKFNRQTVSDIRMRVWQILRIRERKTIDQHSRFVEQNPESARQIQEEVQQFQAQFLQFFQAYGAAMRVREQQDEWDDLEKRLLNTVRDLQDRESVDAEIVLANLDPKIRAEAERRVKNVIEKRARLFGKYILDRYGDDDSPWLDMTPERRIQLAKAARDGDDDAKWELENWARKMYSHDEIVGINGEKYRITAQADYSIFSDNLTITTKIWHVDSNGDEERIGDSHREMYGMSRDVPQLYNASLFIEDEEHQGQGIGGVYNSHAFMYAKAAGFTKADVSAADDGPYVWARLGFRGDISQENIDAIRDRLKDFDEGRGDLIRSEEDAEIIRYLIAKWVKNSDGRDSPRHIDFMMALSNTERPGSVAWHRRQRQIKNFFLNEFALDSGVFIFNENMVVADPRKLLDEIDKKALNILAGFGLISTKALGNTIGRASRVGQVSEVDGDGDGFLTGPDGEDNVPAPKQVAEKLVRQVADAVKPTDDLMEARKTGRPWKPLMFDALTEDEKIEFGDILKTIQESQFNLGREQRTYMEELDKKYGGGYLTRYGNGSVDFDFRKFEADHPEVELDYKRLRGRGGVEDRQILNRIREFDQRTMDRIRAEFEKQQEKARKDGNLQQFTKMFGHLGEVINVGEPRWVDHFADGIMQSAGIGAFNQGLSLDAEAEKPKYINPFKDLTKDDLAGIVNNPDRRIGIAVQPHVLEGILADGRIKTFFEIKRNGFIDSYDEALDKSEAASRKRMYLNNRLEGEQKILGIPAKTGMSAKNRPIYGFFFPNGVRKTKASETYGGITLVMKRDVEDRSTFTAQDSLNGRFMGAAPINDPSATALIDFRGQVYGDRDAVDAAFDGPYGFGVHGYAEAQIHGGVAVDDIAYVVISDDSELSESIRTRLDQMGIPIVKHAESTPFKESDELRVKEEPKSDAPKSYVLFATSGPDKIFVPEKPKDGDLHGMVSIGGKPRKRIENIAAFMKFGYWEVV